MGSRRSILNLGFWLVFSLFDLVRWLKHVDFVVGRRTEYDRGGKTFSAEGRLSQVEFAIEVTSFFNLARKFC